MISCVKIRGLQWLAGLGLALLLTPSCGGSDGRSLVPVDVSLAAGVTEVATVRVQVTQKGATVGTQQSPWTGATDSVLKLGVYLDGSIEGAVEISARGLSAAGATVAESETMMRTVSAGGTAELVRLTLGPTVGGGDGGVARLDGTVATDGPRAVDSSGNDAAIAVDAGPGPDGGVVADRPAGETAVIPDAAGNEPARADVAMAPDLALQPDLAPDVAPPQGQAWTPGAAIESDPLSRSYRPRVGIDPVRGNAIVVWEKEDNRLLARRYDAATKTWGDIKKIEDRGEPLQAHVGIDAAGKAVIAWYQSGNVTDPLLQGAWASTSADGTSWTPPFKIQSGRVYHTLALAVARNGSARVAWQQSENNKTSLWSAYYNGTAWVGATRVKDGLDSNERYPAMAMNANGGGILAFNQEHMGQDSIWASTFAGATLDDPLTIESYNTDSAFDADVGMNPDGKAMAVWAQRNGSSSADGWSNEYVPGMGWKGPVKILTGRWVSSIKVVVDRGGIATAAWSQNTASGKDNVVVSRQAGTGWGAPEPLETNDLAPGRTDEDPAPKLGVDAQGVVHAVWRKRTSAAAPTTFSVWTSHFSPTAMKWSAEEKLGGKDMLRAWEPELATADNGVSIAAFYYVDSLLTLDKDAFTPFVAILR